MALPHKHVEHGHTGSGIGAALGGSPARPRKNLRRASAAIPPDARLGQRAREESMTCPRSHVWVGIVASLDAPRFGGEAQTLMIVGILHHAFLAEKLDRKVEDLARVVHVAAPRDGGVQRTPWVASCPAHMSLPARCERVWVRGCMRTRAARRRHSPRTHRCAASCAPCRHVYVS